MRNFWVKRGEWVIGPVTEPQIRQMARQQWFRATDQLGLSETGPWKVARAIIPPDGFNAEQTTRRESILEPVEAASQPPTASRGAGSPDARSKKTESQRAGPQTRKHAPVDPAFGAEATLDTARESPPEWFRRAGRKSDAAQLKASDGDSLDHSSDNSSRSARSSDALSERGADDSQDAEVDRNIPPCSEDRPARRNRSARPPSMVDDLFGDISRFAETDTEPAGRFQTAEFEAAGKPSDAAHEASDESCREDATDHRTDSGDWNSDVPTGVAPAGDDSKRLSRRRRKRSAAVPDRLEADVPDEPSRKPVTDWELVINDLNLDDSPDAPSPGNAHDAVPFELSVHSLKTGRSLSAAESAASGELDFARLANLAAADPALSRSQLPAARKEKPPPNLISPEERDLRRTIGSDRFQTLLSIVCLTIGLQSCVLSTAINGLLYVALRRFFLLSTEVFFPWGTGSLEILEGTDLALAGTAMAVTFALPFLALSYLVRIDGRVLPYLISLGVGLLPAIAIGSGALTETAGTVLALLLLVVPALVAAVLCGMLTAKSSDEMLQKLLAGATGAGVLVAVSIGFSAPAFNIGYLLRELPPELRVTGGRIYVAMLFHSVQLTLMYFLLARIAKFCLDRSTQNFVTQHMHFHGMLTAAAFLLIRIVHSGTVTGWGTAPVLLGGLTAVVSLGFNLWSLTGHLEPRLDRLRIDD